MKYLAVYDLRLLPLAVGDMVSWVANKKLDAYENQINNYDLAIVMPYNFKGNLLNEIRSNSYWLNHLKELMLIFESDTLFNDVYIVTKIDEIKSHYVNRELELNLLEGQLANQRNEFEIREYIESFQKYDRFNKKFQDDNIKIILESKKEFVNEAISLKNKADLPVNTIICQPRFRAIDSGLPLSDPKRDSNFLAWYDFLNTSLELNSNIKYLMIGRTESLPIELKQIGNCLFSRDIGMNLAHEIALIRNSTFFLGASSGFAVVANFSKTGYQIFNTKKGGYDNFGINCNKTELVFSNINQNIFSSEISINTLKFIQEKFIFDTNKSSTCLELKRRNFILKNNSINNMLTLLSSDLEILANNYINSKNLELLYLFDNKLKSIWPNVNIFILNVNSNKLITILNITICKLILLRIFVIRCSIKIKDYYEISLKYLYCGLFFRKLISFIKG